MRKIIFISILLISAASCTNIIDSNLKQPEPKLILSALLSTGDEVHKVYVSMRMDSPMTSDGIGHVSDAEVVCYINGEFAAEAVEQDRPESWGIMRDYQFRTKISPGDLVRIEASKDGKTAYAEMVAPQPVELELTDTTTVEYKEPEWIYSQQLFKINFKIKDAAGSDNYFRLDECRHTINQLQHYKDDDGNTIKEDSTDVSLSLVEPEIGNDPILNGGYMPESDGNDLSDILSQVNPYNKFRVFSDEMFKDADAKVGITLNKYNIRDYFRKYDDTPDATSAHVTSWLDVVVQCVTFETYCYLKALNAGEMYDYETNFLTEPVIIPTNVVGGLGFVGISTDSKLRINFPERYVEFEDGWYWDPGYDFEIDGIE